MGFSRSNPKGATDHTFANKNPPLDSNIFKVTKVLRKILKVDTNGEGTKNKVKETKVNTKVIKIKFQSKILKGFQQGSQSNYQEADFKALMNLITQISLQLKKVQVDLDVVKAKKNMELAQSSSQPSSSSERFPATTENPRNQVNAITTRSEKTLKDPPCWSRF